MKFALCLLVLLPLAHSFFIQDLLNTSHISEVIKGIFDKLGADPTESACESECNVLLKNDLVRTGCDFICLNFQSLAKRFGHHTAAPATT